MAQAAQVFHVQVANASAMECRSDAVAIKLRIVAGTRNGAHIDESLHSVGLQEGNEIVLRAAWSGRPSARVWETAARLAPILVWSRREPYTFSRLQPSKYRSTSWYRA